eukprot:TRINITY_DN7665_c0_g1_i1.p1 TRINITY_DN7665_c0_g1~~TRINITY_DN7665_c0_g1_i1.p1  ORF type:complete len:446 (+),score=113.57 TRINITY_DN7665_c0_g1_i1:719-2056(+)
MLYDIELMKQQLVKDTMRQDVDRVCLESFFLAVLAGSDFLPALAGFSLQGSIKRYQEHIRNSPERLLFSDHPKSPHDVNWDLFHVLHNPRHTKSEKDSTTPLSLDVLSQIINRYTTKTTSFETKMINLPECEGNKLVQVCCFLEGVVIGKGRGVNESVARRDCAKLAIVSEEYMEFIRENISDPDELEPLQDHIKALITKNFRCNFEWSKPHPLVPLLPEEIEIVNASKERKALDYLEGVFWTAEYFSGRSKFEYLYLHQSSPDNLRFEAEAEFNFDSKVPSILDPLPFMMCLLPISATDLMPQPVKHLFQDYKKSPLRDTFFSDKGLAYKWTPIVIKRAISIIASELESIDKSEFSAQEKKRLNTGSEIKYEASPKSASINHYLNQKDFSTYQLVGTISQINPPPRPPFVPGLSQQPRRRFSTVRPIPWSRAVCGIAQLAKKFV